MPGGAGTILQHFVNIVRREPTRPLIHLPTTGSSLLAGDVWDAHLRYATRLTEAGIKPHELILSAAANHPAAIGLLLAARAIDAALLAVDGGTAASEIFELAERFKAAALIVPDAMCSADVGSEMLSLRFADGLRLLRDRGSSHKIYPGAAILKLTSGSTGTSKAVLTTEAQLISDGRQIIAAMEIRPADTQIAAIAVSHSYGLGNLLMPLFLQGTAIVLRDSFIPPQLADDAARYSARVFPGVPFMFEFFIANPPIGGWPPSLTHLISAGAPLTSDVVRAFHDRFGIKIHSFYGTSETGGITFDSDDHMHEGLFVGRPLPGVALALEPEDGMPPGAGRIHVRSAAVSSGYSDGTRDGFGADGFLSGDYGVMDDAGALTLLGRVSSFVNVAGRKVHPAEVERLLRTMPGVADVRVMAAPDARRGEQIVACIVPNTDGMSTLTVRRYCASRLAAFKIPRHVIFVEAIPITPRGKTDRAALDALVQQRLAE